MGTDDRGQAAPLMVGLIALAVGAMLLLVPLARAATERAQARTAADAAALAGAVEGETAAREVAAANGARLLTFAADGTATEVTVSLGRARASARAQRVGGDQRVGQEPR